MLIVLHICSSSEDLCGERENMCACSCHPRTEGVLPCVPSCPPPPHTQTCFIAWSLACKMPPAYDALRLYKVHRAHIQVLGVRPKHVEIMAGHLRTSLLEIGVNTDIVEPAVAMMLKQKWIFEPSSGLEERLQLQARER